MRRVISEASFTCYLLMLPYRERRISILVHFEASSLCMTFTITCNMSWSDAAVQSALKLEGRTGSNDGETAYGNRRCGWRGCMPAAKPARHACCESLRSQQQGPAVRLLATLRIDCGIELTCSTHTHGPTRPQLTRVLELPGLHIATCVAARLQADTHSNIGSAMATLISNWCLYADIHAQACKEWRRW